MRILIIGSGGREHAIAWKFAQNSKVEKIYVSPGNAGTELLDRCENIELSNIEEMVNFAKKNKVGLTMVGSEELLVEGIVDKFEEKGLIVFGPDKKSAILEGSKAYSKDFMKKYGVKTAAYEIFNDYDGAIKYLDKIEYPTVIKASGLAAGKGVIIAQNKVEAVEAVKDMMLDHKFSEAGSEIVIEEFLEGVEASILSITDGNTIVPFISAKDHKKIGEGEIGLNTGGMGVIAPNPYVTPDIMKGFINDIMTPTLEGLKAENMKFNGVIFFGLMITKKGIYSLEYNMRLGDPETQAVLPLMENDFLEILEMCIDGNLDKVEMNWKDASACCVVGVSGGYPENYKKGYEIRGLLDVEDLVFIAGAKLEKGKILTNGGRVINIVSLGETLEVACKNTYSSMEKINFEGLYCRKDIGKIDNL
ncbi:MAG: phosphoribosylamine--glycine ligase [Psychrilyobacter sp.]|uniref:phosphoribosylamine--glycine ligase n=1 Tax=Psychrilyobacter sp. TaxID=2586924 RepID=UPI003C75BF07